ncbi:TolC family protein [Runella slithyformis]|uniref:Outer membrane efflux protein n=1 Tax=Runella slithyformis (strain ATCC 29530 / DSM 19594 / LMG 11500 / NCIMB 11436 / LSU 4) TaxID=761193 RepID=A0A7U3ZM70_RUNSL|nr:TolC family protein [Runella slithyformis]AEI49782.1 outer membrane efflux protein [Runella slithyformis DSM 19594]
MKLLKLLFAVGITVGCSQGSYAQTDTLRLTLPQAEAQFIQKNFVLLAQKYNVNSAEAAVQQAKLWYNPNLFAETNLFNGYTGKVLPYGKNTDPYNPASGVFNVQLQQIVSLSGTRSKLVRLAETNVQLQQAAFNDLMRTVRYQLAQTFGSLAAQQHKLTMLQLQKGQLESLLAAFRAQLKRGVIAPYEVTRLELEQNNLESDLAALKGQISQDESAMRILLSQSGVTYIEPVQEFATSESSVTLTALLDLAYANRPDLQVADKQVAYNRKNLVYQKALATPNLTLGADYQHVGGPFPNYVGIQALIDLPIRNKNQGNIQAAKLSIEQAGQGLNFNRLQVEQEVIAAYQQYQQTVELGAKITPDYLQSIQDIAKNATEDYTRRVIDLVSFIDKIRAYKDAQMNLIELRTQLFQAQQQIDFVTNTKVF